MNSEEAITCLVLAAILAVPLCISLHLTFRWFQRSLWERDEQKSFWRSSALTSLISIALWTVANVSAAVTSESAGPWGKAAVAIWGGYFLFIVPLSLIAGVVFSLKYRDEE